MSLMAGGASGARRGGNFGAGLSGVEGIVGTAVFAVAACVFVGMNADAAINIAPANNEAVTPKFLRFSM